VFSPDRINFCIERLSSGHDRTIFCCGVEQLDRYFQQQATQDQRRFVAAPFVALDLDRNQIIGYYTLSATSILLEDLPPDIAKKLPKYPLLPATLLGRLAIHQSYQKQGWGDCLLMDALYRSYINEIASIAVVVDALNESAVSFYEYYQFIRFPDHPHRLFLPMKSIQNIFK
jgi:GNAT superfamily N-acetyltransferase